MKTLKNYLGKTLVVVMVITAVSCVDKKNEDESDHMETEDMHDSHDMDDKQAMKNNEKPGIAISQTSKSASGILADYFQLKNALVADDTKKAGEAGAMLETKLASFDINSYSGDDASELKDIIEDAKEHAEHIAKSDITHQREHFKILSQDIIDMLEITGAGTKVYEQYCPMYDNNKGGAWLSASNEIKNPYFGSKMLTCGKVQREIL